MNEVLSRIQTMGRKNRLAHGLLLVGSQENELKATSLCIAQQIVCEKSLDERPCGLCMGCKKVLELNHPDVLLLEPEKQELTIDEIRSMHTWLLRGPFEARAKVGIVSQADSMNAAAANSTLKILEEPPAHAYLVLLARGADSLLPTILSRVQQIRFLEKKVLSDSVAELPPWMEELEQLLSPRQTPSPQQIFHLTEAVAKDRKQLLFFFERIEKFLRDEILQLQITRDFPSKLACLDTVYDQIQRAERHLVRRYGNISLTLDPILLRWLT